MAWSVAGWSLRSDRPSGLVGRYIATDSFAGRFLRSDRLVPDRFDGSTEISARFHRKNSMIPGYLAVPINTVNLYEHVSLCRLCKKFSKSVVGTFSPSRDALSLSSHTLSPLSSAYKIAHVRSGVRRRVRARSGAGSSPLTFCLLFLRCCLFLSVSASIYSRICVSDLAPGSSPPERSDGSGGDSVSSRFVGIGDSCGRCLGSWRSRRESDSSSSASAVKGVVYGSSIAAHGASHFESPLLGPYGLLQLRVLLFGSRRLQVWDDSRLQSLIASVARLVLLTSQLCRGSIVLVQWCNISSLCRFQGFRSRVWWRLQPVFCLDRITSEVDLKISVDLVDFISINWRSIFGEAKITEHGLMLYQRYSLHLAMLFPWSCSCLLSSMLASVICFMSSSRRIQLFPNHPSSMSLFRITQCLAIFLPTETFSKSSVDYGEFSSSSFRVEGRYVFRGFTRCLASGSVSVNKKVESNEKSAMRKRKNRIRGDKAKVNFPEEMIPCVSKKCHTPKTS
uniref:Uncharacterized protein n=1 Tax=Brassica oleracea var. oleracea TaxID=109376 RepID=A0A0D3D819_BRAOL